jgi:hypothetical protein
MEMILVLCLNPSAFKGEKNHLKDVSERTTLLDLNFTEKFPSASSVYIKVPMKQRILIAFD